MKVVARNTAPYPVNMYVGYTEDGKLRCQMVRARARVIIDDADQRIVGLLQKSMYVVIENIIDEEAPPLSVSAGPPQDGTVGETVTLDGTASVGVTAWSWTFKTRPDGSQCLLEGDKSSNPAFTPDKAGVYTVELSAGDGLTNGVAETVITVADVAPTVAPSPAPAEPTTAPPTQGQPTLPPTETPSEPPSTPTEPSQPPGATPSPAPQGPEPTPAPSTPPSEPSGETAAPPADPLGGGTDVTPTAPGPAGPSEPVSGPEPITPAEPSPTPAPSTPTEPPGPAPSEPSEPSAPAPQPVANAGSSQTVTVGTLTQLDGSQSTAVDSYLWSITLSPGGSATVLSDPAIVNPTFTPDVEGTYVVSLTVTNANGSNSASVTVDATAAVVEPSPAPSEPAPAPTLVANAGNDQSGAVATVVQLDGSQSVGATSYAWALTGPAGTTASLSDVASVSPTFTPDLVGTYTVTLTVSDGTNSVSDETVITVA